MKLTVLLLFIQSFMLNAKSLSQQVTLSEQKAPLEQVFSAIERQTHYIFFYNEGLLNLAQPVTVNLKNVSIKKALDACFKNQPFTYDIVDQTIILKSKLKTHEPIIDTTVKLPVSSPLRIYVIDSTGKAISEVSVIIKGSHKGASTDLNGEVLLSVSAGDILIFSHVGMEEKIVKLTGKQLGQNSLTVTMSFIVSELGQVHIVSTGIYERDKASFTGSYSTYTEKDLKMVGNQNVLQSLKTLDPSFAIIDNNDFGSDPNHLPNIEINGKSSIIGLTDQYGTDPNQPLFILDGFESSLQVISDLSMDRVASITLLKDASATAIYGSKAANGVVVIETKKPAAGKMRVNYNLSTNISYADLSDYNLMNSSEKLQFELLSGFYGSLDANGQIKNTSDGTKEQNYYNRLAEIKRGVNTYWLNEPLHLGIYQRHTLFAEGGDNNLRYGVTLNYGDNEGVMKSSSRKTSGGTVQLTYRKGRLSVNNTLTIDYLRAKHEIVSFSKFARTNPYYRKANPDGTINKILESYIYANSDFTPVTVNVYNPLYDELNHNVKTETSQNFTNNFEADWDILKELRFRARFGIRKYNTGSIIFNSPFNSEFDNTDPLKKGDYTESNGVNLSYDGDASLTYGKLLADKHMVNFVAGMHLEHASSTLSTYKVEGFVDDEFANPDFAFGYPEGDRAAYKESVRRGAGFYMNGGYAYDQRFLLDATIRSDGSSIYGADRQFTHIWSLGIGWNINNEKIFKNSNQTWLTKLKLRASIGNPGNQNFDDYISMRVYQYNNENRNPFGASVILSNFGNNNLQWQKTLDRNVGMDATLFKNKLDFTIDYFYKKTDPLLVYVTLPSSNGTNQVAKNIGEELTKGFTAVLNYMVIQRKDFTWRINLNMRHMKSEYDHMGDQLANFNTANQSKNMNRYYDGGSPSDLWTVRSLGIDPATGREIFLTKDGNQTFVYNYDDEVVVGNSDPKLEGVIGSTLYYKGFSLSLNMRYRIGGQIFMNTLYDKVENITAANVSLNQDKRALYDRWKKPGDRAKFKSINNTEYTPMSSRFVQDNNNLVGESFSLGYETTTGSWLKVLGASSVTFRAYLNDIFYVATVTNERGIDYPYARTVSFSAAIRF